MSLADLLDDLSDEDEGDGSDHDPSFAPGLESVTSMPQASGGARAEEHYGVPYDDDDDDDDDDDIDEEGDDQDGRGSRMPSDEIRFSHERFFSARLRELLRGTMVGGCPASHTGLLTGVRPMLLHQSDSPHPERPARMVAIYHEIIEQGLDARTRLVPARPASVDDLRLVHTAEQVRKSTGKYSSDEEARLALGLDSDTYFSAGASGHAALLSAGSVVELTTRVVQGELRNALAVVRPPGHHCECQQAMGFCVLNNVCVAVAAARRRFGVGRVMIVDWDVHHGNGVQHIFDDDPTVLYVSLHR